MKSDALLQRFDQSVQGSFGLLEAGHLKLYTGELPPRENRSNISCIPPMPGEAPCRYLCGFTHSPRFGRHLYILGAVPNRSGVRVHPANLMGDASLGFRSQLNGCISCGEKLGWMDGQKAVLLSAPAVRRLETYFGGRPFILEIRNSK